MGCVIVNEKVCVVVNEGDEMSFVVVTESDEVGCVVVNEG